MPDKKQKLIIVDASAVLHRAWHALPKLTDPKGRIVNAVYGFTTLLLKLLREQKPDYITITFDTKAPTFRHKKYKEYKATRVPQPQEFYDQIPIVKDLISAFDIQIFAKDGFEADDLIGTINNISSEIPNLKSIIISGDKDLFQLVDDKTEVYFLKQGLAQMKIYNQDAVFQRFDLNPKRLIDFKALSGDPSDNIPGVKNIGPKTALGLIKKFGSIEKIYQHLEKCHTKKEDCQIKESLADLLLKNKKEAFLGKELVTIKQDVKGIDNLENCKIKNINQEKVKAMFEKLGFNSLIRRLEQASLSQQNKLF